MARDRTGAIAPGAEAEKGAGANRVALEKWQMARTPPGALAAASDLASLREGWIDASAPGTVASALRDAGMWDWRSPANLDDDDWWYRCNFQCARPAVAASLEFQGLASLADVWLNGVHLLSSDNMFVAHTIDTGTALRAENELVIRFRSLNRALTERRPRPRWRTRVASHQNLRWIRTTLLGRIPGWSSFAQPVGPWKAITLISHDAPHDAPHLVSRRMDATIEGTDGVVSVTARLRGALGVNFESATISVGSENRQASIERVDADWQVTASIRVPHASIWWPHTHGQQPLYDVALKLGSGDQASSLALGRVGFRDVRLDSTEGRFQLEINGTDVFWRGACWCPPDPFSLQSSREQYRRILTLARDAGMNMLRVGGTMVYEHDDFYDLCDELGIVVWQDLMFANMDYPHTDAAFIENVRTEVKQLMDRIAARPSLALVCGNSEVEQQAAMLGLPQTEWRNSLFASVFPEIVASHASGIPYWASSPSGGELPFHVNAGDGHYFGFGPYLRSQLDVRASNVQFASECMALANPPEPEFIDRMECGSAGAGHHPDWKRGVPRDNGAAWDFEDVRDHYVGKFFSVDPAVVRYGDPERYLALGRVAGGELMVRTVSEWRRSGSPCSGALLWFYNDLRPGAGWGVLDSEGNPKAAYYYLARVFSPIAVLMTDEGLNGIGITAINDTGVPINPELRLSLLKGATLVGETTTTLTIGAHASVALTADALLGTFTDVSYAYMFGKPNHDAVVVSLIDPDSGKLLGESFHFPTGIGASRAPAHIQANVTRISETAYSLTIASDELALAVAIEAIGWRLSDNYFNIAPGRERTILLSADGVSSRLSGRVTALNGVTSVGFHAATE
ncbi:MAG: glycoside hydrolase family 2 protein [Gemmatimonadaceae bacterium]